jgi:potassium-dependent mechanosensitive channel
MHTHKRSFLFALMILVLSYGWGSSAVAQSVTDRTFRIPSEVTVKKIQAKMREIEGNKDLEEKLRDRLLTLYRQAQTSMETADSYEATAGAYQQETKSTPTEIARISQMAKQLESQPDSPPKTDYSKLSLPELEQQSIISQTELEAMKGELSALEELLQVQRIRPPQVREAISSAKQRMTTVEEELKSLKFSRENPLLIEAHQAALEAERQERLKETMMLNRELYSYGSRLQLFTAQRDLMARRVSRFQNIVKKMEEDLKERQQVEVERSKTRSALAKLEIASKDPILRRLVEENSSLGKEIASVYEETKQKNGFRDILKTRWREVEQNFRTIKEKVELPGMDKSLGPVLIDESRKLTDSRGYEKENRRIQSEIAEIWARQLKIDDSHKSPAEVDQDVEAMMRNEINPDLPSDQRSEIKIDLRKLLVEQQSLLDKLSLAYTTYLTTLGDLDSIQRQLIETVRQYKAFLEGRIYWLPSSLPLGRKAWEQITQGGAWLLTPSRWEGTAKTFMTDVMTTPILTLLAALSFLTMLWGERRWRTNLSAIAEKVGHFQEDRFALTFLALLLTLLMALPWPILIGFIGWRLREANDASEFTKAVGLALWTVALVLFYLKAFYLFCCKKGVAEVHLQWNERALKLIRRHLAWYTVLLLPFAFMGTLSLSLEEPYRGRLGIGRLYFVVISLALAFVAQRLLRPAKGALENYLHHRPEGWVSRLRYAWYPLGVGIPVLLAGLAITGYYYSALIMGNFLISSLWLIIGAKIIHDLVIRWLRVVNLRLILRREAGREKDGRGGGPENEGAEVSEDVTHKTDESNQVDLPRIYRQIEKLLNLMIGLALVMGLLFIWAKLLPALSILDRVTLWQQTVTIGGKEMIKSITLGNLALAVLFILLTIVFTQNLPGLLEMILLRRLPLSAGTLYALTHITQYVIVALGVILVFQSIGGRWGQIQWLVAALGVGLGFGLQEIVANFVCGIILLFERPLRVGDWVTIGDMTGIVSRIHMRATTIIDWDNRELIVPNKTLITGQLVNWTLSNQITRVTIKVNIAFGSDILLAQKVISDVVKSNPLVMDKPEPRVFFLGFGEGSLSVAAYVFVKEPTHRLQLTHDLYLSIEQALGQHGITIPFPQREIHVREMSPAKHQPALTKDKETDAEPENQD